MPRYFRVKFGRKTVQPFKEKDLNNMIVICKKKYSKYQENENNSCPLIDKWMNKT